MMLEKTTFKAIQKYAKEAKKERVFIKDYKNGQYFKFQDKIVAIIQWPMADGLVYIRSVWMPHEYRGKGIGQKFTDKLLKYCKDTGARGAIVWALNPPFYTKRDWTLVWKNPKGPPDFLRIIWKKKGKSI